MQGHAVAVARQRDIGSVAVHARRGQHMGPVHRHALRLVDRGGIAMIDVGIVLGVEGDAAAIVGAHGHALRLTCSTVPSVPFLTPRPRSLRRNMMRSPLANWRSPRSALIARRAQLATARSRPRAASLSSRTSSLVWVRMIRVSPGLACRSRSQRSISRRAPPPASRRHAPCRVRHRPEWQGRCARWQDAAWRPAASRHAGGAPR
jgi:hypothetical protein